MRADSDSGKWMRCGCIMLLAAVLLSPVVASAGDLEPIIEAGYDNLNKLNARAGVLLYDVQHDAEMKCERPGGCSRGLKYMDAELGMEGVKVTVGSGVSGFESMARFGLGYARFRTQRMIGVEFSSWYALMVMRLGVYHGLNGTPNRFMLGLAFGY